jgi:transposase
MTEQQRNTILSRWREGASMRQIALELHRSRHTVRRVVLAVEAQRAGQSASPTRRANGLDAFEAVMRELLARYPHLTGMRLWEELRQRGYSGSYSTVRVRLRELRPHQAPLPVVRFETGPGQQAQMDYATYDLDFTDEGRRRVYAFSYVLAYSRRQYLRFVEAQDLETTLRQHVRAFDYFKGVAATCLYDNMKVVVQGHDEDVPLYNQRFLAFATHYGFRPHACRPYRPQTKGKVERRFLYVETSLLNGRTFRTLEHLNEVTTWWLAQVADVRLHGQTKKTPLELYALELPHLIPLPAQPYEVSPVCYRVVNVEGDIVYRQNRYSVPWQHIGRTLPVRITETEVIIYDPVVQEIARHPLFARSVSGQCCHQKTHRPSEEAPQRQAQLQARFAEVGEAATRFLDALLRTQRYGKDQAQRVLVLLATYARADVLAALERAVRYGAFSYTAVERILAVQAQPKSVLETLAEEQRPHLEEYLRGTSVSARPLTDYQSLFNQEITHDTPAHSSDATPPAAEPRVDATDASDEPA